MIDTVRDLATLWVYFTLSVATLTILAILGRPDQGRTRLSIVREIAWAWGGLSLLAWVPIGLIVLVYFALGG